MYSEGEKRRRLGKTCMNMGRHHLFGFSEMIQKKRRLITLKSTTVIYISTRGLFSVDLLQPGTHIHGYHLWDVPKPRYRKRTGNSSRDGLIFSKLGGSEARQLVI